MERMAHRGVVALVLTLSLTPSVACADSTPRPEAACRNVAALPARAHNDVVAAFGVDRCGFGTDPMCRAMRVYFRDVVVRDLDPLDALGPGDDDVAMAALAEAFHRAEERVGASRSRQLNQAVVAAATAMGSPRGRAIATVMDWMPGGSDVVTATSPAGRLLAIRVVLERVVDLCVERP